jgi:thymidylate kinase
MFIVVEGIGSAGKKTQAARIAKMLDGTVVSFPDYESASGRIIRGYLRGWWRAGGIAGGDPVNSFESVLEGVAALNAELFQMVNLANKVEHAGYLTGRQMLGLTTVADRYWPSSWVYGVADGLDGDQLLRLNRVLPQPDVFLLIDVDIHEAAERRQPGQRALMEWAADLYRDLWARMTAPHGVDENPALRFPLARWVVVDGRGGVEDVWNRVKLVLRG